MRKSRTYRVVKAPWCTYSTPALLFLALGAASPQILSTFKRELVLERTDSGRHNIDKNAKKKNGLSRYRVRVKYIDTNGEARQIERLVWGKAAADLMERQLEAEYKDKRIAPLARMTVEELYNKYAEYHITETRRSSHETAMKQLRLWVLPYFKNKRIDRLTQQDFANWKIALNAKGLQLKTKQNVFKTFVAMLNFAVRIELISKNGLSALGNFKDSDALENPSEPLH